MVPGAACTDRNRLRVAVDDCLLAGVPTPRRGPIQQETCPAAERPVVVGLG
jgi:hypothetical protein